MDPTGGMHSLGERKRAGGPDLRTHVRHTAAGSIAGPAQAAKKEMSDGLRNEMNTSLTFEVFLALSAS